MFVLGGSRGRQSLTVEALTEGWGEEEEEKKEVEEEEGKDLRVRMTVRKGEEKR